MPTAYDIDAAAQVVRSSAEGRLTEQESWDHYARMKADPAFSPTFRQLCDLRQVTEIEASAPFLRTLAKRSVFAPGVRRAFVAAKDYYYGLARMLQVFAEAEGTEVGVFRTMEEAEDWLGLPPRTSRGP